MDFINWFSLSGQCQSCGLKWYHTINGFTVAGAEHKNIKAVHRKLSADIKKREQDHLLTAEVKFLKKELPETP